MATTIDYDPFSEGGEVTDFVETTDAQREILTTIRLGGAEASLGYNEATVTHFRGALDQEVFAKAFALVVKRHDALRSVFSDDGTKMMVLADADIKLEQIDLGEASTTDQESRLRAVADAQVNEPFDLTKGPVGRATLVRTDSERHAFFFTAHHLVYDGWSAAVVLADLAVAYSALLSKEEPKFAESVSFFRYAREERKFEQSSDAEATREFWRSQYRTPIPFLELPRDFADAGLAHSHKQYQAGRYDHLLDGALIDELRSLARKERCSFFMLLLASFAAQLYRLTGERDLSIGYPAAGQSVAGYDFLVGHCVYSLPLRLRIPEATTFGDLLQATKRAILEASEHQRITIGRLVQSVKVDRKGGRVPIAVTMFNLDTGMDTVEFKGLEFSFKSIPRTYNSYEFSINASDARDGFVLECSYWRSLYSEATIAHRMQEYETLLRSIVRNPSESVDRLNILSEQARQTIVQAWNKTEAPFPFRPVTQRFTEWVQRAPDATCVVFGEEEYTYAEIEARSAQLANCLTARGVRRGDRVGVCVKRGAWLPISLLAIMRTGASYVPIDSRYPVERVSMIFSNAGVKTAIVSDEYVDRIEACPDIDPDQVLRLTSQQGEIDAASPRFETVTVGPLDLAYILHTSGSTGVPKGVPIHHEALSNYTQACEAQLRYRPQERILAVVSASFDLSVQDIFITLSTGATCVVASEEAALEADTLINLIDKHDITVMLVTPSTWRMLVEAGWRGKRGLQALSAGEPLQAELAAQLGERVGELWNLYGPTEATIVATMEKVEPGASAISIGTPVANYTCFVLDEAMQPVPVGVAGELWIGGLSVARGYLNQPELTAERFLPDPFSDREGALLYRTGDRARWTSAGKLECLDRLDNQVKIRGYRIELGEIEAVVEQLPEVAQAVARCVEDASHNQALVAYIRPSEQAEEMASDALSRIAMTRLRQQLPSYMLPSKIIVVETFALGTSGKVDRKALPDPNLGISAASNEKVSPRTPVEEAVLEIWQSVLGITPSIFDNFFELGGHSMHAIEVIRLAGQQGLALQPADVLRHPTVAELARVAQLQVAEGVELDTLVVLQQHGNRPPLYVFHSLPGDVLHYGGLVQQLGKERPVYGFQGLGTLDAIPKDAWSIDALADHYAKLLERFHGSGPLHLAGWCFGGSVALSLAQRLKERGASVGLVILMEAWPARGAVRSLVRNASLLLRNGRDALPHLQRRIRASLEPPPDPMRTFALEVQEGPFRHRKEIYTRNLEAVENHRTRRYDGEVLLIKSALTVSERFDEEDYGWREFVERLEVRDVHAHHEEMLRHPAIEDVGRFVREQLRRTEQWAGW